MGGFSVHGADLAAKSRLAPPPFEESAAPFASPTRRDDRFFHLNDRRAMPESTFAPGGDPHNMRRIEAQVSRLR